MVQLGAFELLTQIGFGPDGSRHQARNEETGEYVEVRLLSPARDQPARWKWLVKRLRLAAMLRHPGVIPVHYVALDRDPAYVVMGLPPGPHLAHLPQSTLPWNEQDVRDALRQVASALGEGHRLGLAHGDLSPVTIFGTEPDVLRVDFTGLRLDFATSDSHHAELETACRPPESATNKGPEPEGDLFSLGVVCGWLARGQLLPAGWRVPPEESSPLALQLQSLLASDPADRPTAASLLFDLLPENTDPSLVPKEALRKDDVFATQAVERTVPAPQRESQDPTQLGRFKIEALLGEGGLGRVFRGIDLADGTVAAIKVLHPALAERPALVRRFHKEARLMAELNNPFIVNLLENNEDQGIHYLALEFIDGPSLSQALRDPELCPQGRLPESFALAIGLDVTRALLDAHRRGIIHRDIKPQNIMIRRDSDLFGRLRRWPTDPAAAGSFPTPGGSKLCDFGLARHVVESDSLHLTQEGTAVGTPLYMSPEQAAGRTVTPATDVYALGATLYHVLAGQPPFSGDTALALSLLHANEAPPPLKKFNPDASEGVCRLLERCLAKKPQDRFADGAEMLEEMERLVCGEPAGITLHPRLPEAGRGVREYNWIWELASSPEQLWPYVSNTERFNHAAGLSAVQFTTQPGQGSVQDGVAPQLERLGTFRKAGVTNTWREHPFEWIEGRRLGVLREYTVGVFKWLASTTTLERLPTGGTRLIHNVRIEPRNFLGKLACAIEVGFRGRRAVERVYRRIDAYLSGQLGDAAADAFEKPIGLSRAQKRQLQQMLERLSKRQTPPEVVQALENFLENGSDQEVARIRPLALAGQLEVNPDSLTTACLLGAREGLFTLLWDILCPLCRIPSGMVETLKALKDHGHCDACQANFAIDFGSSVELIFRVHPSIRAAETKSYCVGGPAHSPHVAAQVRLGPGETFQLDLGLEEGLYRLRGPQLPRPVDFVVDSRSVLTRLPIVVPDDFRKADAREPTRLQTGKQRLTLTNNHSAEVLLRVERQARRTDALTAARASTLAVFRELFPREVLEAGKLVSVSAVTFLAVDLGAAASLDRHGNLYEALGEARAFSLLHDLHETAEEMARSHQGALVKTVGDSMLLAFDDKHDATRAALDLFAAALPGLLSRWPDAVALLPQLRAVLHHGPALAATVNDRLDYFGTTLQRTLNMLRTTDSSALTLSSALASDPEVMALLHDRVPVVQMEILELPTPELGMGLKVSWPD